MLARRISQLNSKPEAALILTYQGHVSMMRERFAMNRPDELERFFNSFSYSEICHELAADGSSCVSNEKPLAVYHNNQIQNNSLKQAESIQAETKKAQATEVNAAESKYLQTTTSDKRKRTLFTPFQLARMEDEFRQNMYVVGLKRWRLATELCLTEKQVKIWFQNRRMKLKREQVKSRCINDGFPWY